MQPTYYDILGVRQDEFPASTEHIKKAYRRALLQHHPDKSSKPDGDNPAALSTPSITVDDIALAYKTLSEPLMRAEYDRLLRSSTTESGLGKEVQHTGLETVDLDDLVYGEQTQAWSRACRCGAGGFVVTESELEKNLEDRELIVGCKGCSLWLRVLFSVEE